MTDAAGRRRILAALALAPLSGLALPARAGDLVATAACRRMPEATEGPFYIDPYLLREDITEGRPGLPLRLRLQAVRADCTPIEGARIDVWHCDAQGRYSGVRGDRGTFLRGTQVTGPDGTALFRTVFPGWYPGRTPHVHLKLFLSERAALTAQLYFPDEVADAVYAHHPAYAGRGRRDRSNETDRLALAAGEAAVAETAAEGEGLVAALVVGLAG